MLRHRGVMRLFFIGFPPLTFHLVLSGAACGFVALLGLPGGYICLVCEMRGTVRFGRFIKTAGLTCKM
jgi:hypothetical protein